MFYAIFRLWKFKVAHYRECELLTKTVCSTFRIEQELQFQRKKACKMSVGRLIRAPAWKAGALIR